MQLYTFPLSGHAHRAHLFTALIGADVELIEVDLAAGAHKTPEFLRLNPFGQVPVLVDGETVIPDSNAILVYLATRYGFGDWLPTDAAGAARVQRWLSVAAGPLAAGPAAARLITLFDAPLNAEETISRAHAVLTRMEQALDGRAWFAADHPTIADVALYSYTARAPEGNVSLAGYPALRDWLGRVEALPGFVAFPTSPVGLEAGA